MNKKSNGQLKSNTNRLEVLHRRYEEGNRRKEMGEEVVGVVRDYPFLNKDQTLAFFNMNKLLF